ncbi:MAG: replication-associated recombination protein A [Pseudomonadales bacterium]|nr:replication-associated recombination protein A [Pseudomonadales bacterium]
MNTTDAIGFDFIDSATRASSVRPLAARVRPTSIENYCGQEHILGPDSALRQAILNGELHSMILWGPPGTGKTTLAKILAEQSRAQFETLSAVSAGVKDIRQVVELAKQRQQSNISTLLFIDEVHRFNKSQQDALLPHIEDGLFVFIGATTENPSFELNNALLSRVRVYTLQSLSVTDLINVLTRAIQDVENGLGDCGVGIDASLIEKIANVADGDARSALGMLELAVQFASARNLDHVDDALLAEVLRERASRFDKKGEHFYDQISALHKSVRGSAPDGALYWFARMLEGGCDPLYIARRVVRMASEDIGNADPRALTIALNAWDVQSRLGSPEGELSLAQAVVYLAVAPKSNAVYKALAHAKKMANEHGAEPVPLHLRNAPTDLMKSLDYGAEYRYAHDYDEAYAAGENYLPEALKDEVIYQPTEQGLEAKIKTRLAHFKTLDLASDTPRYSDSDSNQ